jgi:Fic family protein
LTVGPPSASTSPPGCTGSSSTLLRRRRRRLKRRSTASSAKASFWLQHRQHGLGPEQLKVLNRLLDGDQAGRGGFAQGISAAQYQTVARVSKATATRHLADLVAKGCLIKLPGGGRNTRYQINWPANGTPLSPEHP